MRTKAVLAGLVAVLLAGNATAVSRREQAHEDASVSADLMDDTTINTRAAAALVSIDNDPRFKDFVELDKPLKENSLEKEAEEIAKGSIAPLPLPSQPRFRQKAAAAANPAAAAAAAPTKPLDERSGAALASEISGSANKDVAQSLNSAAAEQSPQESAPTVPLSSAGAPPAAPAAAETGDPESVKTTGASTPTGAPRLAEVRAKDSEDSEDSQESEESEESESEEDSGSAGQGCASEGSESEGSAGEGCGSESSSVLPPAPPTSVGVADAAANGGADCTTRCLGAAETKVVRSFSDYPEQPKKRQDVLRQVQGMTARFQKIVDTLAEDSDALVKSIDPKKIAGNAI